MAAVPILDNGSAQQHGSGQQHVRQGMLLRQRHHREPFRESQRMAGETGQDTGGQGCRDDRRGCAVLQRGTDTAQAVRPHSIGVPAGVCEGA